MPNKNRETLPFWSPRCWHGMTAGVWLPFLFQNRVDVSLSRVPLTGAISFASLVNSGLRFGSELFFGRRANRQELETPPLFVIGHWRTGTTMLHELLVKDERTSYPTTFQCFCPHHFLLTEWALGPIFNLLLPNRRPMDNMAVGMSRPQEDEFAIANLGAGSPYLEWAFPNRELRFDEFLTLEELDQERRQKWADTFLWFLRRLTVKDPRRLILKSPTHTARLGFLRELLPEARFVHIARNPLTVIPSTLNMWERMADAMSLHIRKDDYSLDRILDVFERMYQRYEADRPHAPPNRLYEVRYEDLVKDPLGELTTIYERLELGDFGEARPRVEAYLDQTKGYQKNQWETPAETKAKIAERCGDYIQRYGYAEHFAEQLQ